MNRAKVDHLGIIMDGNRRWAKANGLPSFDGHRRGFEAIKKISDACWERNIKTLTVFAFSTENWQRTPEEVKYLLDLFAEMFERDIHELHAKNIKLVILGDITRFPDRLQQLMRDGVSLTTGNTRATLNIALNYGGREEIVHAVREIVVSGVSVADINQECIAQHLYTAGQSDPDLIIRTSGEQRLSGFLPWQGVYSELYFTETHWPAFTEDDLDAALEEYAQRQRRFGK